MKRNLFYSMIIGMIICLFIACNNDDFIDDGMDINGYEPSFNDTLAVPTESVYLGDSIQLMKSFDLNQYPVGKLTVSTTENGYIAVLGGYKQYSAVYVYAKLEEELPKLTNEEIKALLNKYYLIESHLDGKEIVVTIKENTNIAHGNDFHKLRISIKAFTPCNVSTQLNISKGNIFINNLNGELHEASLSSGSIKYLDSRGKKIQIESQNGFIGLINTIASENIDVKLTKGSIQIAVPQTTRATLALQSTTSVNAYVLDNLNFEGKRTQTLVKGKLNGGGYSINAVASLGNVTFRWYDKK